MTGRQSVLREEHLVYAASLLLRTWSGTVLLWGLGRLSYGVARWVGLPAIPLVSLLVLLNARVQREGWVTPIPAGSGRRAVIALATCIVIALASTMTAVLV